MQVVTLIQARMSSSRLPGKVLLPLAGRCVLDHVIDRCRQFSTQVIVCTSVASDDDAIVAHCKARGVMAVRGPLDDVFQRFRMALADSQTLPSSWFARVTADCPLVSVSQASLIIGEAGGRFDYIGTQRDEMPLGLSIELIRRQVFEALDPESLDLREREHVTLHLYETPGRYRCRFVAPAVPLRHPEFRLTLDYPEDYELLSALFAGAPDLTAEEAVATLVANPSLADLNRACTQKGAR